MLSIVIICKNEERFIAGCVESAISATSKMDDTEIVVVDSSSGDRTIDIVMNYPVAVYQLGKDQRHTPAAGRYIGFLKTRGEYVLFLDGDSFLETGFIEEAIKVFEKNRDIGAIIGKRREVYYGHGSEEIIGEETDINGIGNSPNEITVAMASALYRRDVLEEAGSFNPYLFSEEEAELSDRIRRKGYKIIGIPADMVVHHTLPRDTARTYFKRMKSNLHLGPGQILRYRLQNRMPIGVFREIGYGIDSLAWSVLGILGLAASIVTKNSLFFLVWLTLSFAAFAYMAIKNKSIVKPLSYLLVSITQAYSIVRGFMLKPMAPETYPTETVVIKDVSTTGQKGGIPKESVTG